MCEAVTDAVGALPTPLPLTLLRPCPQGSFEPQCLRPPPDRFPWPQGAPSQSARELALPWGGGSTQRRSEEQQELGSKYIQVPPLSWMDPSALPAPCPQQQLTLCQSLQTLSLFLPSSIPSRSSLGSGLKRTTRNSRPNFRVCFSDQSSLRHKHMAGVTSFSLGDNLEKQVSRPPSAESKIQKVGDPCQGSQSQ